VRLMLGVCGIFANVTVSLHFSRFEFFLRPSRILARPPAGNASRWHAPRTKKKKKTKSAMISILEAAKAIRQAV